MSGLFDWLNGIMTWLGSWIPRVQIIRYSEAGIRYRHGKDISIINPGIIVYWPIFTEIEFINVKRQVLNLRTQLLTTVDKQTVVASGLVVYRINDVQVYLVENHDADAGIHEVTTAIIRRVLIDKSFDEIQTERSADKLDKHLTSDARKVLKSFGISVEAVRLTDFAKAFALSHAGDGLTINIHPQNNSHEA